MARPEKSKRICTMPSTVHFSSHGGSRTENAEVPVELTIEEFETIRLIDYSGMTQQECAAQMHVARTTVQRLYTEARAKVARFLVDGSSLTICGGNYELCQNSSRCCKKFGCPRLSCGDVCGESCDVSTPDSCIRCGAPV